MAQVFHRDKFDTSLLTHWYMDIKTLKIFIDYTELYEPERHELIQIIDQFESTNIFLRKIFVDQLTEKVTASENNLQAERALETDCHK
jgi:hypothetical protein